MNLFELWSTFLRDTFRPTEKPQRSTHSGLPKLADTPEGRRESPYYRPQPYSDKRLGRYFDSLEGAASPERLDKK